jgi:hypothetical protein
MTQTDQPSVIIPSQPSRPWYVTLLALGVLIIAGLSLVRLILTIRQWQFLASWPGVSPYYLALSGLVWTLVGLPVFWGLWRGLRWAPQLTQALALTFALYYWMDHIFLVDHPLNDQSGAARSLLPVNWPFAAGITAVMLSFTAWALNRPRTKAFFALDEAKKPDAEAINQQGKQA